MAIAKLTLHKFWVFGSIKSSENRQFIGATFIKPLVNDYLGKMGINRALSMS